MPARRTRGTPSRGVLAPALRLEPARRPHTHDAGVGNPGFGTEIDAAALAVEVRPPIGMDKCGRQRRVRREGAGYLGGGPGAAV